MDECEKCNETAFPEKEEFYSNLNMGGIADQVTCMQKKFVKTLKQSIKMIIKIYILKVIHYFWMMQKCVQKIYQLDSAKFLSPLGLAWKAT